MVKMLNFYHNIYNLLVLKILNWGGARGGGGYQPVFYVKPMAKHIMNFPVKKKKKSLMFSVYCIIKKPCKNELFSLKHSGMT